MSDQPITVPEDQVVLNLSMSYGPILVGAMLSCVTWGISCMQIFIYHMTYEDDGTAMKLFVFFVWIIDTANQILLMASLWPALILRWGSPAELSITQPTLLHRVWVSAVIAFAVQMFFLGRIYRLSIGKFRLSLIIVLLPPSLFQLVATIPWEILAFQENHALSTLSTRRVIGLEIALRASGTFVDIAIATAMVYYLHGQRRSTFFVKEDDTSSDSPDGRDGPMDRHRRIG
ncbi:hypothetical protein FKP32DRAFT_1674144 [Trametes sanguinea]|nr:hypothetical protein FKP32DRAFT_1674144 [Trametes sanguinea]